MNKKLLFFIGTILICGFFLFLYSLNSKQPIQIPQASPTPMPPLAITETFPANSEKNAPLNPVIALTFNKSVSPQDVTITIAPTEQYIVTPFENTLVLQLKNISKETTYSVIVNSPKMTAPYSFSFTTSSQKPEGLGPFPQTIKEIEEIQKNTAPGVFLSNRLPHAETSFSMNYFMNKKTGYFRFGVVMKGSDSSKSKQEALLWMRSIGLNDEQIQKLTIVYISESVQKLIDAIPYDGNNFTITYDLETDKIQAIVYKEAQQQGDVEMNTYLKSFGITDQSQIPNFTVVYQ